MLRAYGNNCPLKPGKPSNSTPWWHNKLKEVRVAVRRTSEETTTPTLADKSERRRTTDWEMAAKVVTLEDERWEIDTFEPYKSAGSDGIFLA